MKTTHFETDDTLVIRFSEKPVTRETSKDWHTHISYSAEGDVVEIVVPEAKQRVSHPEAMEFVVKAA